MILPYWMVVVTDLTAEATPFVPMAINFSTDEAESVIGPVYLAEEVVGVVPLVV